MAKSRSNHVNAGAPLGVAFAISIVAHAMALSIPYPSLWTRLASMPTVSGKPKVLLASLPAGATKVALPRPHQAWTNDGDAMPPAPRDGEDVRSAAPPPLAYALTRSVERPPEIVGTIDDSLFRANEAEDGGSLLLRLIIDEDGIVRHARPLRSTLPRNIEGEIVMRFFRAAYRPAEVRGRPVAAEMLISITVGALPTDASAGHPPAPR